PAAMSSATTFRTPLDAALSPDGKTAYFIALEGDEVAVYKSAAPSSEAPTKLDGASGYRPRGVVIARQMGADVVYFTGKDKEMGLPGVFKLPLGGGAVT